MSIEEPVLEYSPEDYTGPEDFVHHHVHTIKSSLDGVATVQQYSQACVERGVPGMSVTEHGHCGSIPDLYFEFKKNGLKPVFGCEVYYNDYDHIRHKLAKHDIKVKSPKFAKENPQLSYRIRRNRHLTVLVKNEKGLENLIKLTTLGSDDDHLFGMMSQFNRVSFEDLCKHKEGLIILSGCLNGPVAHELHFKETKKRSKNPETGLIEEEITWTRKPGEGEKMAREYVKKFKEAFGEDYYIELQMPGIPEIGDDLVFKKLVEIADDFGLKTVLTNDCHYLTRKDYAIQSIMMATAQGTTVDDPNLFHVNSSEQYFKRRAELWAYFMSGGYSDGIPQSVFENSCDNTLEVIDKVQNIELDGSPKFPKIEDDNKKLINATMRGLKEKGLDKDTTKYLIDGRRVTYKEQAAIELQRFISKGFSSYFLIIQDLIMYGKSQNYMFGPRGCAMPGSQVTMSDGCSRSIELIEVEDQVLDGFGNPQKVLTKFVYDVDEELFEFELEKLGDIAPVTGDHKFYVVRDCEIVVSKAKEIKKCDRIISCSSAISFDEISSDCVVERNAKNLQRSLDEGSLEFLEIKSISKVPYKGKVYDIHVEGTNTYQLEGVFSSNSAGGSLVCYLLGIHSLDPLKWSLSFDRFLSEARGGYALKMDM